MKPLNDRSVREVVEVRPLPECSDCGSTDARHEYKQQSFRHGSGDNVADLTCDVLVYSCNQCGCEWTGSEAEEARQNAVCRHLGRLTPGEVRGVRDRYRLSQAEFSRITGFGEASLSRWETGAQIQNAAIDRLLRLIESDEQNLYRLQHIADRGGLTAERKFRVISITPELLQRKAAFQLRPTG